VSSPLASPHPPSCLYLSQEPWIARVEGNVYSKEGKGCRKKFGANVYRRAYNVEGWGGEEGRGRTA